MTGRTHDVAAFTSLLAVALVQPLQTMRLSTVLIALLANQIGGIMPDIDQPTAPFWRNLPIGGPIGKIFGKLLGGHRFLTHSVLGLVLFGAAAKFILAALQQLTPHTNMQIVWWAFMIGMVSHLVLDSFTKEGVPWLLPLPIKFGFPPLKRLRITTGKHLELLVILPALVAIDVLLVASHYQLLLHILKYQLIN